MPDDIGAIGALGVHTYRAAQRKVSTAAGNIASSNDPSRTEHTIDTLTNVLAGRIGGILISDPRRIVNPFQIKVLKDAGMGLAAATERLTAIRAILQTVGEPTNSGSIVEKMTQFKVAWERVHQAPADTTVYHDLTYRARELASCYNSLSSRIQSHRNDAALNISRRVDEVNGLLVDLQKLNAQMRGVRARGKDSPDLADKQDDLIRKISTYLNISTSQGTLGEVHVSTSNGIPLIDKTLHLLSYDHGGSVTYSSGYPDVIIPGILVEGSDITAQITNGAMSVDIEMRDSYCVQMQEVLDESCYRLVEQVNALHNKGMGFTPHHTLTSERTGLAGADAFAGSGTIRIAVIDKTTGHMTSAADLDLSTYSTIEELRSAIDGIAGVDATITDGRLVISSTDTSRGITIAEMSGAPVHVGDDDLGFSHYFGFMNFFSVSGYSPDGLSSDPAPVGISARVSLSSALSADSRRCAAGYLRTDGILATDTTTRVFERGDASAAIDVWNILNERTIFNPAGDVSAGSYDFIEHLAEFSKIVKRDVESAEESKQVASDIRDYAKQEFDSVSGINVREQTLTISRELAFAQAGAAIMNVYRELLNALFSVFNK